MSDNNTRHTLRQRRRNRVILGIITGLLVTVTLGTGLSYAVLRIVDSRADIEPTLPQLLREQDRIQPAANSPIMQELAQVGQAQGNDGENAREERTMVPVETQPAAENEGEGAGEANGAPA
ncbi:MAG: hypothetical protein IKN57_01350, partial [Parasporobacterium sp.]|nr:hypothetical protein [Parasporobacterium sp.]